jgi:DNA-binding protein HU-beta
MTKAEIVKEIADATEVSQADVEKVVDDFVGLLTDTLGKGEDFIYPKLGKFTPVARAARTARNPHTGEDVAVPAKTVVKYKAAAPLARFVNGEG